MILPAPGSAAAAAAGLRDDHFAALCFLVHQARAEAGWRLRGVRGWHFYREVVATLGRRRCPDTLRPLVTRKLAGLVVLPDPTGGRACLYRAEPAGAYAADLALGREHVPLGAAARDEGAGDGDLLFMPLYAWAALCALREAKEAGRFGQRWAEPGWMTSAEIGAALGGVRVYTDSLYWLGRRGMVQRRQRGNPGRTLRPVVLWRVAAPGERAHVVDDYGVASELNPVLQVALAAEPRPPVSVRDLGDLLRR